MGGAGRCRPHPFSLQLFGFPQIVYRDSGVVVGGLGAESAVFGTQAAFGIDDGAFENRTGSEMLPDFICAGNQVQRLSGIGCRKFQGSVLGDPFVP